MKETTLSFRVTEDIPIMINDIIKHTHNKIGINMTISECIRTTIFQTWAQLPEKSRSKI